MEQETKYRESVATTQKQIEELKELRANITLLEKVRCCKRFEPVNFFLTSF